MVPTRALVILDSTSLHPKEQIDGIKRMAMIFDEISYILAPGWRIKDEVAKNGKRFRLASAGNLLPVGRYAPFENGFHPLDDVSPDYVVMSPAWKAEMEEVLSELSEAGITRELSHDERERLDPSNRSKVLIRRFVETDYRDDEFLTLNGSQNNLDFTFGRFGLAGAPDLDPAEIQYIDFPSAIKDSIAITESLFFAHLTDSNPVFIQPQFHGELDHRYRRYREGVKLLKKYAPEIASSLRLNAHFGEVSFRVANSIIDSRVIEKMPLRELIEFRNATENERQRYVSSDLRELDQLVDANPWGPQAKAQINDYLARKLAKDLMAYNDAVSELWTKFYGKSVVKLTRVAAASVMSGVAGHQVDGISGHLLPNATGYSILAIGSLVSLAKQMPEAVQDLIDTLAERRELRRSSIAYVARFSRRQE